MKKNYVFQSKPFDYSLFIQGVVDNGKPPLLEGMIPATQKEITAFEKSLGCELPNDYRDFLLQCNGGAVNPFKMSDVIGCDVVSSANGGNNHLHKDAVVDYFYTLDRISVEVLAVNNSFWQKLYLPNAQIEFQSLLDADDKEDEYGLSTETLVLIASSSPFGLAISCDGLFKNKVISIDFSSIADQPLDNVGILANSFDEFLQSLYYLSN